MTPRTRQEACEAVHEEAHEAREDLMTNPKEEEIPPITMTDPPSNQTTSTPIENGEKRKGQHEKRGRDIIQHPIKKRNETHQEIIASLINWDF